MTEIAEALKAWSPSKVNKMKRSRFYALLGAALFGVAIYRAPEILAAMNPVSCEAHVPVSRSSSISASSDSAAPPAPVDQ